MYNLHYVWSIITHRGLTYFSYGFWLNPLLIIKCFFRVRRVDHHHLLKQGMQTIFPTQVLLLFNCYRNICNYIKHWIFVLIREIKYKKNIFSIRFISVHENVQNINFVWFHVSENHFCNIQKGDYVSGGKYITTNMYDTVCWHIQLIK